MFVATLAIWLVTVRIDNVVRTREIIFQEVHHNVALLEAMPSIENTRILCQSLQATLPVMARPVALKLVPECTIKAINTAVLVGARNHGSVNQQVPQHHGSDKTVAATITVPRTRAVVLHHGLQPLLDMGLLLGLVPLLGSRLHHLVVTAMAIRAMQHLDMILMLVATALLLLRQA